MKYYRLSVSQTAFIVNQSINQSIVYLPFSFLTDYTSVIDFITLGQELIYMSAICRLQLIQSSNSFFFFFVYPSYVLFSDIEIFLFPNPGENKF